MGSVLCAAVTDFRMMSETTLSTVESALGGLPRWGCEVQMNTMVFFHSRIWVIEYGLPVLSCTGRSLRTACRRPHLDDALRQLGAMV